jgi:hypothetical protein
MILVVLLLPLHFSRRRRNRERLARMAATESAAEALERETAIEALLKSVGPQEEPGSDPRV